MDGTSFETRDLAEQLASVRRTWSVTADEPAGAFGHADLTGDYRAMVDAWFAEIGTHIDVLETLRG